MALMKSREIRKNMNIIQKIEVKEKTNKKGYNHFSCTYMEYYTFSMNISM